MLALRMKKRVALLCGMVVACGAPNAKASDEVRAIVGEMMADARTRGSLLDDAVRVADDGTFTLAHEGGATLQVRGELQFRYLANHGSDDDEAGFQMRRSRIGFRGRIRDGITYRVRGDWRQRGGAFRALSVHVDFDLDETWSLRLGQFQVPFDRERGRTGATRILTIERSIVSSMVRLDRAQGAMLTGRWSRTRLFATLSDGVEDDDPFALRSRLEFRVGDAGWGQYRRQSWRPGDDAGALVGFGVSWQGGITDGRPDELANEHVDLYQYTGDIAFGGNGAGALIAASGRTFAGGGGTITDWGVMVQGSMFVGERVEGYARYAHLFAGDRRMGGDADFNALTVGANWYPLGGGRALRLSADATWYPRSQSASSGLLNAPDTSVNLLPDRSGGQVALTLQAQIVF